MPDTGKRGGYPLGGTLLGVFLFVYIFLPYVFVLPVVAFYGYGKPIPPAVFCLFRPIDYLDRHVPFYHRLLEAELKWIGVR